LRVDRWYAPAWIARARCELFRGNLDLALKFAKAGQVADPEDLDATTVLAEVYDAKGQDTKAWNQLDAFVLRHPESKQAANHLDQWSSKVGDRSKLSSTPMPDQTLAQAILKEELVRARARATELRLPQSEVARLALELNRPALANQQMTLLVNAAPHDSELRALALLAAHRADDAVNFQRLLSLPATFTSCSPACSSYLDQILVGYAH
jgi:hypothetical protein